MISDKTSHKKQLMISNKTSQKLIDDFWQNFTKNNL